MSVDINPGQNWQNVYNANSGETLFIIKSGNHIAQRVNTGGGKVFQIEEGANIDGNDAQAQAFVPASDNQNNVQILGPVGGVKPRIHHYNPGDRDGAIASGDQNGPTATGWIVKDLEVGNCGLVGGLTPGQGGDGIRLGNGGEIHRCYVHHCDEYGVKVGDNGKIIDCEISFNGHDNHNLNKGGTKITVSNNVLIQGGWWHHNERNNIWLDINNVNYIIECVKVTDARRQGIFVEISNGGIIRNCLVMNNGLIQQDSQLGYSAGIAIGHSSNVEVYNNEVYGNWKGIYAFQQAGREDEELLTGLHVHDNNIYHVASRHTNRMVGIETSGGGLHDPTDPVHNNRYQNNHYFVHSSYSTPFTFNGAKTFAQWQNQGMDINGTYSTFSTSPNEPAHPCGENGGGEVPPTAEPSGRGRGKTRGGGSKDIRRLR